jgi:hypothetical protein
MPDGVCSGLTGGCDTGSLTQTEDIRREQADPGVTEARFLGRHVVLAAERDRLADARL